MHKIEKLSKIYYRDDDIIVCKCAKYKIPQVIWKKHCMSPSVYIEMKMITLLNQFAEEFYGHKNYYIDTVLRSTSDRLHYYARLRDEP